MTPHLVPCGAILHTRGEHSLSYPTFLLSCVLVRCAASAEAFLEHYRVGELLGVGGFAVVKRGIDRKTRQAVASRCRFSSACLSNLLFSVCSFP